MTLSEQVDAAIMAVKGMFKEASPIPPIPPDMTLEKLWILYNSGKKRTSPGVEEAVRLLLENEALAEIPISMIAEIIREVFTAYNVKCACSESSVRWYQSQRNLEWSIVRRRLPRVEVRDVAKVG